MRPIIALASMLFASTSAMAFDCRAPINDLAKVISDPTKVERALSMAGNAGANVRVVTYDTLPTGKNLHKAIEDIRLECPTWQNNTNTKIANTLVVIGYASHGSGNPAIPDIDMNFGDSEKPFLDEGRWKQILKTELVPSIHAYAKGDKTALTEGFVNTARGIGSALASPASTMVAPQAKHAPDSRSEGGSNIFAWFFGILVIAGIGGAVWFILGRRKDHSDENSDAQSEATTAWGRVSSALSEINNPATVTTLGARASADEALKPLFDDYKRLGREGANEFALVGARGENPNTAKLPITTYRRNKDTCDDIFRQYIVPARDLARQIRAGVVDPRPAEKPVEARPAEQAPYTPQPEREPFTAPPSPLGSPWNRSVQEPPYPAPYQPPYQPPYQQPVQQSSGGMVDGMLGGVLGGMMIDNMTRGSRDGRDYQDGIRDGERRAEQREDDRRDDREEDARFDDHDNSSNNNDDDDGGDFAVDTSNDGGSSSDDGGSFSSDD